MSAPAAPAPRPDEALRAQTLQTLLQRIRAEPDFPTLRESMLSVQRIAQSDEAHLRALSESVLKDVALTGKVLRLINAAYFGVAGAGSIDSIERAVSLLGLQAVAMLAASLLMFERLPMGVDTAQVRELMSRALLSALLARELCRDDTPRERAYLTALFLDLGPLLAAIHLPQAEHAIEDRVADMLEQRGAESTEPSGVLAHECRHAAAREVLGLTLEDLAIEVAIDWGWPESVHRPLRRLYHPRADRAVLADDYLRVLCTGAADLSARLHELDTSPTSTDAAAELEASLQRFHAHLGKPLGLDPQTLPDVADKALASWRSLGDLLAPAGQRGARRARRRRGSASAAGATGRAAVLDAAEDRRMTDALAEALARASRLALSEDPLQSVMQDVADQLLRALGVQRVVVCLRDPRGALRGMVGAGRGAQAVCASFHVPMGRSNDLFSVLAAQGRDTLISDSTDTVIARRLPDWYAARVSAATFLVLPLARTGRVVGLIYADRQEARSLVISTRHLSMLEALRNQLVMAIRLRRPEL
jgi:HD-like signal output (HDOD) protein